MYAALGAYSVTITTARSQFCGDETSPQTSYSSGPFCKWVTYGPAVDDDYDLSPIPNPACAFRESPAADAVSGIKRRLQTP